MSKYVAAFLIAIAFGFYFGGGSLTQLVEAANPPSPYQQNADIYEVAGYPSPKLQTLNPLTQKIKKGSRTVTWDYMVVSGCQDGNMFDTLQAALSDSTKTLGITFVRTSNNPDITVRANCGTSFYNICGAEGAIACLGRGWPYVNDVDAITTMSTFYFESQESIWLHEIMGHALATWNEQYQFDGSFSSTPNLVDFMNTGPLSRYIWPQSDIDRWERTMYTLGPSCGLGPVNSDGFQWDSCANVWRGKVWDYDPAKDEWFDKSGVSEWCCDQTQFPGIYRYNRRLEKWVWICETKREYDIHNPNAGWVTTQFCLS